MTPTDTARCEPPEELRGVDGWHTVRYVAGASFDDYPTETQLWRAGIGWTDPDMELEPELWLYVAPIGPLTPPAVVAALVEALEECAGDLEAEIVATYAGIDRYPSEMRKKDRDMAPVRAARAALALYRGRP